MRYAELQVATAFSFLRGASKPEELAAAAKVLGLAAIGVADLNTVAGVVRAHDAARQVGIPLKVGARLAFRDGTPDLLCYPRDRAAWGRLCRLLSVGKLRAKHGDTGEPARRLNRCLLDYADLLDHGDGQELILIPPERLDAATRTTAVRFAGDFAGRASVAATRRYRADDARRLRAVADLGAHATLPLLATNDVLYHAPERRALQDVMTAIRLGQPVAACGRALQPNAERHLKSPAEMARLFRDYPQAVVRGMELVNRIGFALTDLAYEYPDEPVPPGCTPDGHLADLTWRGAAERFPDGVPDRLRATIEKELGLIERLGYARYFLTVHDIVRYARGRGILCQGRGSAANSAVCYVLGVTAVDPTQIDLLFERFISAERREPPDIDVDFEHERREDVIQYIYRRYGRERAGIAATVIHYRPRSAIREVGRALGLTEDATAALAGQSAHESGELWGDARLAEIGLDPDSDVLRRTVTLARELVGLPRHLSQHVGGFVLTRDRLDETVPIGRAAMDERTFIEWDKDDIDTLGIMKVDVLALGMLTCIRKAFDMLGIKDMADVPREDPVVYEMLTRGDSIGVFQVESRAQMNMLPRLRPSAFYDLVIEVAIVRPGPIQGDMVHPYLRRRQGREAVFFPSPSPEHGPPDELERVLGRTLGVPLFQEQAMRIAIEAARFTPEEANQLRRAMATFRHVGTIHGFFAKMVDGMVTRGYERAFAERCFKQIEGFGTYGFPESHAASFAMLVYVSAWLKCHHPATFACALLNAQPMGFYAPAQIVRCARDHGVAVRAADVTASLWDCTVEPGGVLRLGLRQINGFREEWAAALCQARDGAPFATFADVVATDLPPAALLSLADADALRGVGLDRRGALWEVRGLRGEATLPLFATMAPPLPRVADVAPPISAATVLPPMEAGEHVIADYQSTGLSLKAHPMRFLRTGFAREGVRSCAEANAMRDGAMVRVAGVVLLRQRPGNGNVVFITIEDETGVANVVVWASLIERFRRAAIASSVLLVHGRMQRAEPPIVHVIADRLEDRSHLIGRIGGGDDRPPDLTIPADEKTPPPPRGSSHPRQTRVIPPSRDFR